MLTPYSTFGSFDNIFDYIYRFYGDKPTIKSEEDKIQTELILDIPGYDKEDIKIELIDTKLKINAKNDSRSRLQSMH